MAAFLLDSGLDSGSSAQNCFGNNHEGSIPFTRSTVNQGLALLCRKSARESRGRKPLKIVRSPPFSGAFNRFFLKSSSLDFDARSISPPISDAAVGLRSAVVRLPCHGQNMKGHGISKTPEPGSGFKGVTNEANTLNAHTTLEACIVIV